MGEEKKEDPNAWALTYSDMITLLMTFFVLIIAMNPYKIEGVFVAVKGDENLVINTIAADLKDSGIFDTKATDRLRINVEADNLPPPGIDLDMVRDEMVEFMTENELFNVVDLLKTREGFMIRIRADILFEAGEIALKKENRQLLDKIAWMLKVIPNNVRIDGHTDDQYSADSDSDIRLSIARASAVCSYLAGKEMHRSARFSVSGYGSYRPLFPNSSENNRSRNRRVEIVIKEI
ncbi:MAG: OmpA/MotB family protein [Candidatus Loosdrechtia sp.]|uniref:OmpA/MotB family protein n=1 Tax=Candidatus Loosdrechtia sp. TaxID=3101272 RepID=UPI003A62BFE8|nr:MAG: OmpA family protein [Candidatus Jettenia sp. AMX2]